jgi:hypothetical protein
MGKINTYRVLVGKPEGKRQFGRPRRRWDWFDLAQNRGK